ncbi:MAG: molybdopterin molybdotransferase MoeA [Defluviicoccus sp.]|nr:molybdopterin molybdotransferase MoeA [Defluviicoccus sp.]MDE0386086.1 molybdopterin molybdotransferase MoeA [Defluviicoccus sp.]
MAQLSDDCFAFGGTLMTAGEALALLGERLDVVVGSETVPLREARGRILAADLTASFPVPPHDNAAVDGYAVHFDDLDAARETRLRVGARIAAGQSVDRAVPRGEAVRIFTGAPMPPGPDTVLMQEDCARDGDRVVIPPGIKRGANRRHAGEDIEAGAVVLTRGRRLRAQDVGLAASIGRAALEVYAPLRVALFSTGDEIREVTDALPPGCVYDANRYALAGLLDALGCEVDDLGILRDSEQAVREALAGAAGEHDLIMTSGGVSTGEEDHVRTAVEALGAIHFWRLAIRPGRPLALGQVGRVPFIGLPGNPVAVMVTFMRFARPAILRLSGAVGADPKTFPVRAGFAYRKKVSRREWLRVVLHTGEDGMPYVTKFPRDGAGILSSMVGADGLLELPEDLAAVEEGTMVDFLPFSEVS